MRPIIGFATSREVIHAHLDGHVDYYHGVALTSDSYAFAAVPRAGGHEVFTSFDSDASIKLLPVGLDEVVTHPGLLKHVQLLAGKPTKVRDVRTALHALGATHLFDVRLG
jgi:hypothetical protein